MLFQKNNLPSDSQPWGRQVEDRIDALESLVSSSNINNAARDKQLAASMDNISNTINQINSNSESKYSVSLYAGGDVERPLNGPIQVSTVSFTKPSWAKTATVIVSGNIGGSGTSVDPLTGTMGLSIANVQATYYYGSTANVSKQVSSANGLWQDVSMFYSRTFNPGDGPFDVSVLFTKSVNGAAAAYQAYVNATVFWYAS